MDGIFKMKKIIPIIGFKNAGKTKFLNTIYGLNFEENKNSIRTEFINIYRYNPNIKEPKFFHLNSKLNFQKDEKYKEIYEIENIKNEIKRINQDVANKKKEKIDYKDFVYVTEVNNISFENEDNKNYFLKYDLCDLPGLVPQDNNEEFQIQNENEEDELKYKPKGNKYLSEIFGIIKSYIENFIIILDINNYNKDTIKEIIAHLRKVNNEISNCLVLLNKIDVSNNPEQDEQECKKNFRECFPKYKAFNFNNNNIFLPISISELILKKDFEQFLRFHFYIYKSIKENNDNSFINYLKNLILDKMTDKLKKDYRSINDDDIISIIKELQKKYKIDLDIEENDEKGNSSIFDCEEEENNTNQHEEEQFSDIDVIKIIKICYNNNELKFEFPKETEELKNYFKINEKLYKYNIKEEVKNDENIIINNIKEILKNFESIEKLKEKIGGTINNIKSDLDYLQDPNTNNIYIPFLGIYNSGKSTIINGIIGKDILPVQNNECTKKGIIISYCDEPEISMKNARLIIQDNGKIKTYLEFENDIIASGYIQVKEELEHINSFICTSNFNNYSFYNIRINIKLFDEIGLPDNLKKRIHLIDLPGFGTRYNFEFDNLIKICNNFVITFNDIINQVENKNIFNKIAKIKGKFIGGVIKNSIFIKNIKSNQIPINEAQIYDAKREISESIFKSKNFENSIKVCIFNAKDYLNYINNKNFFFNIEETINKEYVKYIRENNKFKLKKYIFKMNNFGEYLKKILISKQQSIELNKGDNISTDEVDSIKNIIKTFPVEKISENDIGTISVHFNNCRKRLVYPTESNIENLKITLKNLLVNYSNEIKTEKKKRINKIINIFETILNQKYLENINNHFFNDLIIESDNFKKEKDKLLEQYKDENKVLNEYFKENILGYLVKQKNKVEEELKSRNWIIIKSQIRDEMKKNMDDISSKIQKFIDKINEISSEMIESIIKPFKFEKPEEYFKEYFFRNVSHINANISEEIFFELYKCFEDTKSMIFHKTSTTSFVQSLFSDKEYLLNFIDTLAILFKEKLDRIFNLINIQFQTFMEEQSNSINNQVEICSTKYIKFSEEDLNYLNQACRPKIDELKKYISTKWNS